MHTRGFSTVEIVIALAIMSLVFGGVLMAGFSSTYWAITSQTGIEALYKTQARLEYLRALSRQDFYAASSTPAAPEAGVCGTGLCYFLANRVTDISPCAKYVDTIVSWRVPGYASSTIDLHSALANPAEVLALGGDCALSPPSGSWSTIAAPSAAPFSPVPAALDVFAGAAFIASNQSPYLEIYKGSLVSYANGFHAGDPINALDVARDETTGRVYAYAAAASTTQQLMVIDVTDSSNPVEVARLSLAGVDPARVVAARVAHRILRPHYIYDDAQHRRARAAYHQCCRSRRSG